MKTTPPVRPRATQASLVCPDCGTAWDPNCRRATGPAWDPTVGVQSTDPRTPISR